ncbi:hypothetical protein OKW22_000243 [Bacilli bacterium PM5-3]|nr:hypothetical protein [Bacilli bacterium PM5-3]
MKTTDELEYMIEEDVRSIKNINKNTKSAKILLDNLIKEKGLSNSKLGKELAMGNYIYEITNLSSTKNVSREKLLCILIYLQADLDIMNEILQTFGHSKIYVKVEYDAVLYHCIINKFTLDQTNEVLIDHGFEALR